MNDFRSYNGFTESIEPTARKVLKSMKTTNVAGFIRQDCENQGEFWYENTKNYFITYTISLKNMFSLDNT